MKEVRDVQSVIDYYYLSVEPAFVKYTKLFKSRQLWLLNIYSFNLGLVDSRIRWNDIKEEGYGKTGRSKHNILISLPDKL